MRAIDLKRINAAIAKPLLGMRPPENLKVSEWADKKRRLSAESSAEPGPWRTSRTPYLREPMDAFSDPKIRRIIVVSSSQIGKSEFLNNVIGYIIDEDPGSILFIHPTTIDAKEYSKLRISPMIRDCPTIRTKVADPKSRDSSNTILQKNYPGGILTLCGSTEAHALASKPIRFVLGDERDRWAVSAGNEGDPWRLAMARQITFYNAKALEVSTPTIKNASAIDDSFSEGTMERWCIQCPHCGEYHDIKFENIRYEYEEKVIRSKKHYYITKIYHMCPGCACASSEQEIRRQPAKWIAENPDAYENGIRSFWLNSFVSPWASWESTILEYLNAIGSARKMQVVYNTRFGELWENRGDLEDEDSMLARREDYGTMPDGETPVDLPDGVLVLTCAVDTQDDRLEYEVVGHGHFGEKWGIKKGIIMGRPDMPEVWRDLDDVIDHQYRFASDIKLTISVTFVDSGGHYTQDVYLACRERENKRVFAIKGRGGDGIPYTSPPKKTNIVIQGQYLGTCWLYSIGVDSGKQAIMDSLKVAEAGSKYYHYSNDPDLGYGPEYFTGLLSERLVYKQGRRNPWIWEKIPGHERNEPLDLRNYANAAFKALNPDLDAVEKRLRALKNPVKPVAIKAPQTTPRRQSGVNKYLNDW